jgi:hypothetical protein
MKIFLRTPLQRDVLDIQFKHRIKEAEMNEFFAVFVVAKAGNGLAATTRAADRGEAGRIGLPGGKVDPGETAVQAAVRESAEEGWIVSLPEDATPAHVALVEGKPVAWFVAPDEAQMLTSFKEAGRITPVVASLQAVADSGYGNEWLVA